MPAPPPPSRPRLVRPDEPSPPPADAAPARVAGRWAWLLPLALAAALVAALGWSQAAHRAAGLEARVTELEGALAGARAEIAAREQHLEAVRSAAADLEARVGALRALADEAPVPPAPAPAPAPRGAD